MKLISKFAAYSMLVAVLITNPLFAETTQNEDNTNDDVSVNVAESENVFVLPELSIDAERASYQSLISRPQDEITSDQLESSSTHNPIEMLRNYNSSVTIGWGLGGSTVTPAIRGLAAHYTNVTIDGMNINTPWSWSSPISGFPLSRLKKITVANPGSALVYGHNAVAGNVNFALPSGEDYEGFTLGYEIGGEGTQHIDIMYGINDEKSQHLVGILKDKYDGTRRFTNGSQYKNSRDNTMLYYKGAFDLTHNWTFKTTIMHNDGSTTVGDSWGEYEKFDPWKMSLRSYALVKDFGNESNFTLRYSRYNDYSRDVYYTDGTFTALKNPDKEDGHTNVNMKTWEALYNTKAGEKNYINLGVQNQKVTDNHESMSKDYQNKEYENTSFFIADSIKATDKLNLHAAIRSDEDYEGERDTSYSFNANYDFNDKTSLGLAYSHTVMLPTLQDLYMGGKGGIYGNPNIKNEKSDSVELRLAHKLNNRWNINFAGYKYAIDDMITTKTADELGLTGEKWFRDRKGKDVNLRADDYVKTNIDEAEIIGYEFGARGQLNNKFNLVLSYTNFNKAEDKNTKVRLTDIPEYRATMALEYRNGKDTAVVSVSHQGKMQETQGYDKVDSSTVCDIYYKRQCNKDFSVYVKVANVGNDKHIILSQNRISKSARDAYYYQDGRVITVGAELRCR